MSEPQESDLVEVANFPEAISAESVRSVLAMDGIEAHVFGGEISIMHGWMTNAFGGVKVMVRRHDLERARELLSEPAEDATPVPDDAFDDDVAPGAPRCPACHSARVRIRSHWALTKDPVARFLAKLLGRTGAMRCRDCGTCVRV